MRRTKRPEGLSEKVLSDLAALTDHTKRSRFLARRRGLYRAAVVQQLTEAARIQLRIDARQSLALAEAAVSIARKVRRTEALGRSLRAKANALYVIGDNRLALDCHEQALRIFQTIGNLEEEGRTLNSSIQPSILLGEYDRALKLAERAREIFLRLDDRRHLAHVELNVGNLYHRQDRFEEGLACYQRAYEMLLPLNDVEGLGVALYNTSVCLISLNDFPRALATYERARSVFLEQGMTLLVGQADYNIAYLYYLRGEYGRAIHMLRAARDKSEHNSDAHIAALCYLDLSDIYLELNLSEEARESAHESYLRFQKLGMGYEEAKGLANEAIALGQRGKALAALDLFAKARSLFVREKNHVWPSLIELYRALIFFNEGRVFEARTSCRKAFEFFQSAALPGKAILCLLLLARIELAMGNMQESRGHCKAALERLMGLDLPILEYQANFLMGEIDFSAGDFRQAYASYQTARRAFETLRSSLRRDELKIAFTKNKSEVYERLVELCLRGEPDESSFQEAFGYMELAKSRSLMERIASGNRGPSESLAGNSELVRRIRDLREELNWYYHRIEEEQLRLERDKPERVKRLQREAELREKNLLRTLRELPASEFENTLVGGVEGLPLRNIQPLLPDGTSLIEYFSTRDRILAAVLTRNSLEIIPLTLVSRVAGLLQMLRAQLSKLRLGSDYTQRFAGSLLQATRCHLQELYAELLSPLGDRITATHVVFVPHGILHSLPFHALFDGQNYMIDRFSVSYAPSAGVLALCKTRPASAGSSSLIMGVPDALAPSIREEAAAVAAVLGSEEVFLDEAATEEVLRERGGNARWIHLATHGYFRKDSPTFSGIRLGRSHVNLLDLYQLRLPAELITLSGCATGVNVVADGDELLGLSRGLLAAGAQCLLLTLWDVHDASTTEFMKAFYGGIQRGGTKAEALRDAMRELRARYSHPFYWAPFFLSGSAGP
jgi:CHAT domain-containing protein/tetratricopeptide (TPR) repeat protein